MLTASTTPIGLLTPHLWIHRLEGGREGGKEGGRDGWREGGGRGEGGRGGREGGREGGGREGLREGEEGWVANRCNGRRAAPACTRCCLLLFPCGCRWVYRYLPTHHHDIGIHEQMLRGYHLQAGTYMYVHIVHTCITCNCQPYRVLMDR